MKKISTLFVRDFENNPRLVLPQVTPGCEWVIEGEGIATRKWDGTCCKIENGVLYKRYDAKHGKTPPDGFIPAQEPDPNTGHWPGWLKVDQSDPANKWHIDAYGNLWRDFQGSGGKMKLDGTYELVGPKINGNRDGNERHILIRHGLDIYRDVPRSFGGLKGWFLGQEIEGLVFHHPDGRMCKIKRSDFGLKW